MRTEATIEKCQNGYIVLTKPSLTTEKHVYLSLESALLKVAMELEGFGVGELQGVTLEMRNITKNEEI